MKALWFKFRKLSPFALPLFFFGLVFLDYAFRFVYGFTGSTRLLSPWPMLFTLGWALLLTSLIALLPQLGRRIAMAAVGVLYAFLALLNGVMFNIFGHFFSFADMNFAGDGAKFFSWTYLHLPKKFLFFLALFLLITALSACLVERPGKRFKAWHVRAGALVLAALAVVPIVCANFSLTPKEDTMWWGNTYNPNDEKEIYRDFTDANRSAKLTGLYQYTFRNLTTSLGLGSNAQSREELDAYYEQRAQDISGENDMTGFAQGKNLIMVMMESVDTWLAVPEYMPNLCRLRDAGVDLTSFYTPLFLSAGTFNTEIISQTGLIPPVTGMSSAGYSTNAFPLSLAHLFAGEGYTVNSFHSANPSIYSRGSIHQNLGFEAYHCYEQMGMEDYQLDSQMMGGYEQMAPAGKFFTFIITYSGHGPYTEELGNIAAPHYDAAKKAVETSGVSDSTENMEEYTRAVAHAMETDQFIGELAERLEQDGRLDDTVLVFYADHYGKYITDKDFLKRVKGTGGNPAELYHTPCFLYGGGLKPQTMDKPASSVDLVPTLVNLFGLPAERRYYVGDDVFGDKGGVVILPNGAWFDEVTYYSGDGDSAGGASAEISADLKRRESISMETVRSDYFKSWVK